MKKILLLIGMWLMHLSVTMAIPAHPGAVRMQQPDGSFVTVRLHGDEYLHFMTTDDGYTVVNDAQGRYVYARQAGGMLLPTAQMAHDAQERTADEVTFLQTIGGKYQMPAMSEQARKERQAERSRQARARGMHRAQQYDYDNFRGLIILVEYSDRKFSRDDYADLVNDMANVEGYSGYDNSRYGRFTGSVRDYFHDNSNGMFTPQFDVVGPISVEHSQYFANGTNKSAQLMLDVVTAADSLVDFSQYDRDGDQVVDMVYFIFAGVGSNYGGNDSRLIWPHASVIYNPNTWEYVIKDDVYLGRYACSTELAGYTHYGTHLDGIGTICHEFGHVLGLPDLYDTDYEGSGGQCNHPADWSIMAGGPYLNNARTPAGYTLYERYSLGFCEPETIDSVGAYELQAIGDTNQGFLLETPAEKEWFLLENRQRTSKWDAYLPGHGLLVFRLDYSSENPWQNNSVNNDPSHNYFEMVRAAGGQGATASDPFPGTLQVRKLSNTTSPANLLTWAGKESPFALENIMETDGVITFDLTDVNVLRGIELPDSFVVGVDMRRRLVETRIPDTAPYELTWKSLNPDVATIDGDGWLTGVSEGEAVVVVSSPTRDGEVSDSCRVIVERQVVMGSIAEFKQLENETSAWLRLNGAQVIYKYRSQYFVRDTTGCIIFDSPVISLNVNDTLNGIYYGRKGELNLLPLLYSDEVLNEPGLVVVSPGTDVMPRNLSVAEATADYYADMLRFSKARLVKAANNRIYAVEGDRMIRVYNGFQTRGVSVPSKLEDVRYDLTGILYTKRFNGELFDEFELLRNPVAADVPTFSLSYSIGEGGSVSFEEKQLSGEGRQVLFEGETQQLHVVADEGYELFEIVLDDVALTDTVLTLAAIEGDHTLRVLFRGAEQSGISQAELSQRLTPATPVAVYGTDGRLVATSTYGQLDMLPLRHGVYVVRSKHGTMKMTRR